MTTPISEDDLHAYADGQLDAARLTQVESWLAAHPEHRAQVEAWRDQSAALHRAFDQVLGEPLPARLLPPANTPRWINLRKFAAVAWVALGLVLGFALRDQTLPRADKAAVASLPRQAAIAHAVFVPEVRHPVEVGAEQEAHLAAWLSKRLGAPLKAPQLDQAGYRLVGGRLLAGENGEVAQFMYENAEKKRLTLYVRREAPMAAGTAFRYASENGVDVFYWTDARFGYALSGSTGREAMLDLGERVYRQFAG
jgi:anti-sigma factor RsiW